MNKLASLASLVSWQVAPSTINILEWNRCCITDSASLSSSFAVGHIATKTVFMKLIYFTAALYAILCWVNSASWLMLISLFFKFLFMVSLYRRRGRPRFLTLSESCEYRIFFGSRSDSIRSIWPVHRKFFLMSRSSMEGSPSRCSTSIWVTLSCHEIFMIARRCLIMKAWSFFTLLLYNVHVSAPYSKVDRTIAL